MALTTAATANITFPCSLTDPRKLAIRIHPVMSFSFSEGHRSNCKIIMGYNENANQTCCDYTRPHRRNDHMPEGMARKNVFDATMHFHPYPSVYLEKMSAASIM